MHTETWEEIFTRVSPGKYFYSDGKQCIQVNYAVWFTPKKIIFNGPATIVFWKDGTKTIVKRSKKDKDNKYNAFCAALAKKIYGSNSKLTNIVNSGKEE